MILRILTVNLLEENPVTIKNKNKILHSTEGTK
jgi:hypothetical protein